MQPVFNLIVHILITDIHVMVDYEYLLYCGLKYKTH